MSSVVPDILQRILARKREEIVFRQRHRPIVQLRESAEQADNPRGFMTALQASLSLGRAAVIAEIKKASPSKGIIRIDFDPVQIAFSYEKGGAACLSVLTDEDFFQGHDNHLTAVRDACNLPVIRKDFMIDPYQIYESRVLGADCVLLIVAALDDRQLYELYQLSRELGMDVLVEVHDAAELTRAQMLEPPFIGINNRDLRSFETNLATTLKLLDIISPDCLVVTESGIHTRDDIERMRSHSVHTFLIGEALMSASEPGDQLADLFFYEK